VLIGRVLLTCGRRDVCCALVQEHVHLHSSCVCTTVEQEHASSGQDRCPTQSCKEHLIEAGRNEELYRLDVDDAIAMLVHHSAKQLLEPLQFDAVAHWLPLVSHTQNKSYSVLESPNLRARISHLL